MVPVLPLPRDRSPLLLLVLPTLEDFLATDSCAADLFAYTSVAHEYLRLLQFDDIDLTSVNPNVHVLAALYPLMWCVIIAYMVTVIAYPQWLCYPLMRKAEDRYVIAPSAVTEDVC